jgi:hypothetical protein
MEKAMSYKLIVRLNGTNENPWHIYNLRCNPFPQIAKYEFMAGQIALNELDGDPLTGPDDIRARLGNKVTDELIELCVQQFKPGERVEFEITFDD